MSIKRKKLISIVNIEIYLRLFNYIKKYKASAFIGIFSTIILAMVDAIFVYSLKDILDSGFINKNETFITYIPFVVLIGFITRGLACYASGYYFSYVARSIVMDLRNDMYAKYLNLKAELFSEHTSGTMLSKLIYDTEQVSQASTDAVSIFIQSLFAVIGYILVMFNISIEISLIYIVLIPLMSKIVSLTNTRIRKYGHEVQRTMGKLSDRVQESIEGFQIIRLFSNFKMEMNKFKFLNTVTRFQDMKIVKAKSINTAGVQILASIGISYMIFRATSLSSSSTLSAGEFTSLLTTMLALLKPLKNLTIMNSSIQRGITGAKSVFMTLDMEEENYNNNIKSLNIEGEITFKNVSFRYKNNSKNVLNNISFQAKKSEVLALVGPSGSGKTTITNLIPAFFIPTSGSILIDDNNINDLSLADLRSKISYVNQNVVLFNDTISNNISYGSENSDMREIIAAAKISFSYDFIKELPNGFDTVIGENGISLSGGQRQRISIARAVFKKTPILILDEATSSLDTNSEKYIQKGLQNAMKGRTTIVIAHRLSTVVNADKILFILNGKIIESGDHNSLIAMRGNYFKYYNSQVGIE